MAAHQLRVHAQVQVVRRDGATHTCGQAGGRPRRTVDLAPGERLTGVRVWQPPAGAARALQLVTSRGLSRRCGGRGGCVRVVASCDVGDAIVGLRLGAAAGCGAGGLRLEGVALMSEELEAAKAAEGGA